MHVYVCIYIHSMIDGRGKDQKIMSTFEIAPRVNFLAYNYII